MSALSKKAQSKINKAVERYKSYLKLKSVGPQSLTKDQLKELVRSGMIKSNEMLQAPVTESYLKTHAQALDSIKNVAPRTMQDGALDFLDRMMDRYAGKAADQLKTDILSIVEGNLNPMIDRREGQAVYEALQDKNLYAKNLRALLKDKVENWEYRWKTIMSTELNRAANWGSMDAILHNNPELGPDKINVYKVGNKPGHGACGECAKMYYNPDGSPKVFKLSELIANGTNIGKKKKDWLPTVDTAHPNCTHILNELKPGFGFVNGSVEYIGADHDAHTSQKPKK